ncbi:MerR family transcriptional regulator [Companilactobacillus mishanensis]|uniref:MerR family transcriptional regulator n=1 Tax=Companilactobacillus mishanensis TaxID=2486008 RepID=UPI000F7A3A10|nr:MerR family transcriptional regulator [Companilactobacillus mishanensis]
MSNYTTGEFAKLGNISVRTAQYYDKKGLLIPSSKTESGRRQYNATDLKKLKLILLLKSMGLKLDSIKEILESNQSNEILRLMLNEQEKEIRAELGNSEQQLKTIENVKRNLPYLENYPLNSLNDIDSIMDNKKSLFKVHRNMLLFGIFLDLVEVSAGIYTIMTKNWIPFVLVSILMIISAAIMTFYYFNRTNYICPNCHTTFQTSFSKFFWAPHNPRARKLTCPNCNQKNYCIEIYDASRNKQKTLG